MSQGSSDASSSGWSEIQSLLQQTQQENSSMRLQLELLKQENRQLKEKIRVGDADLQDIRTDTEKARLLGLEGSSTDEENTPPESNETEDVIDSNADEKPSVNNGTCANENSKGTNLLSMIPSSSTGALGRFLEESSIPLEAGNWEGQSSEGEGSVACLQDRIQQMEENHYSVNEELQATLQELSDLQQSVSDLTFGNEKLSEDKGLVIDALARQISKMNRLKELGLYLKSVLDSKGVEYSLQEFIDVPLERSEHGDLEDLTKSEEARLELSSLLKDHNSILEAEEHKIKVKLGDMEDMLHRAVEEKQELEQKLTVVTGQLASNEVELEKYQEMLAEERQKLVSVFQNQDPDGNLNLDLLLSNARKEKEGLESRCRELEEALNESHNHAEKLQVELEKVEYQFDLNKQRFDEEAASLQEIIRELEEEKEDIENDYLRMKEACIELEDAYDRLDSDRKQHLSTINDLNEAVQSLRKEKQHMQKDLLELKRNSAKDTEEWIQFQKDLQQTVRIANDYREEAQDEVKKLEREKLDLQNKVKSLSNELDRLSKSDKSRTSLDSIQRSPKEPEIQKRAQAFLKSAEKEKNRSASTTSGLWKSSSFHGNSAPQLSVRNLINSIEKDAHGDPPSPQSPVSPSQVSPVRPPIDRRNSSGTTSKRPVESKLRRSATVPIPPPTDRILSSSSKTLDDSVTVKDGRRPSRTSELRTPPNRSEARQNISNVLYRRSDGGQRKTSTSGVREPLSVSSKSSKPDVVAMSLTPAKRDPADPLSALVKAGGGGSKRNALLKWCQQKTQGYKGIDVTNFSSSWNDGLAFCALLHNYLPDKIPFKELNSQDKRKNFTLAFKAGESVGIPAILDIDDMVKMERPHWQSVLSYVTSVYTYFEIS